MAFPDEVARIDWRFTNGVGADVHVVQHARKDGGAAMTALECQVIADHCADSWNIPGYLGGAVPAMKSQANNNTTLVEVAVTGLAPVTPPQAIVAVNVAGSQAGVALPPETALVVSFKTGVVGKSYRGRSFWPGLDPEQLENNGTLSGAALTAYQNMFQAYVDVMITNTDSGLCIWSPTLGIGTSVLTALVRDTPHPQRRRNH